MHVIGLSPSPKDLSLPSLSSPSCLVPMVQVWGPTGWVACQSEASLVSLVQPVVHRFELSYLLFDSARFAHFQERGRKRRCFWGFLTFKERKTLLPFWHRPSPWCPALTRKMALRPQRHSCPSATTVASDFSWRQSSLESASHWFLFGYPWSWSLVTDETA